MALARCKECQGAISRSADYCPHCGAILRRRRLGSFSLVALAFVSGFLVADYSELDLVFSEKRFLFTNAVPEIGRDDLGFITRFTDKRDEERVREVKAIAYFKENRSQVLERIRSLGRAGRFEQALEQAEQYIKSRDAELLELHDRIREQQVVSHLKRVPVTEYRDNRDLYAELVRLNPSEPVYHAKLEHYQAKLEAQQARERELVELLKTIPVEEYQRNRDLYAELVRISPDKPLYRQKLDYYQNRLDERMRTER